MSRFVTMRRRIWAVHNVTDCGSGAHVDALREEDKRLGVVGEGESLPEQKRSVLSTVSLVSPG